MELKELLQSISGQGRCETNVGESGSYYRRYGIDDYTSGYLIRKERIDEGIIMTKLGEGDEEQTAKGS